MKSNYATMHGFYFNSNKVPYNMQMKTIISVLILFLLNNYLLSSCNKSPRNIPEGMIFIPPGDFIIGSNQVDSQSLAKEFGEREKNYYENEKPERKIFLKGFYIDKFEVTIKDYLAFMIETGHEAPPNWLGSTILGERGTHPVSVVSWFDAKEHCEWAGKRLPTEEEWEKAARGPNGNQYPWGNKFDKEKANLAGEDTVPVGKMTKDKSYYGVRDMAGNVMEWTLSWYKAYPGSNLQSKYLGGIYKVVRGGAGSFKGHYSLGIIYSRSPHREYYSPHGKGIDLGFRCAKDRAS